MITEKTVRVVSEQFAEGVSGPEVHAFDAGLPPARLLALLERVGATHLTVGSPLLWQLCAEPAAPITDLSALRHVTHHGPAPTEQDRARAAAVLDAEIVHVPASGPADLVETLSAAADAAVGAIEPATVTAFLAALDEAVLGSMMLTLQRHGLFTTTARHTIGEVLERLGAPKRHRTVLTRWLRALTRHGYVPGTAMVDAGSVAAAWERARTAWAPALGSEAFVDYLRSNADQLDRLVTGEQRATLLLFPQGRTDLADAVYRETITARYLNAAIAAAVQTLPRPLRVLEVGAGTGATTDAVIGALGVAPTDYLFTDVSTFFLAEARERLGRHSWMRFGVYDIDRPAAAQHLRPGSFDLIICAGVLNNARDATVSVCELTALLTPGGLLAITEPTREHNEILISQAFMMTEAEDARSGADGAMFLTRTQWLDALSGTEFVASLPAEDHQLAPLGQRLLLARRHLTPPR